MKTFKDLTENIGEAVISISQHPKYSWSRLMMSKIDQDADGYGEGPEAGDVVGRALLGGDKNRDLAYHKFQRLHPYTQESFEFIISTWPDDVREIIDTAIKGNY